MREVQVGQHHGFISVKKNTLVLFHGSFLHSYEEKETMASLLPKANIFYVYMSVGMCGES